MSILVMLFSNVASMANQATHAIPASIIIWETQEGHSVRYGHVASWALVWQGVASRGFVLMESEFSEMRFKFDWVDVVWFTLVAIVCVCYCTLSVLVDYCHLGRIASLDTRLEQVPSDPFEWTNLRQIVRAHVDSIRWHEAPRPYFQSLPWAIHNCSVSKTASATASSTSDSKVCWKCSSSLVSVQVYAV